MSTSIEEIAIGTNQSELSTRVGSALKETKRENLRILWYESIVPNSADLLYLKDGKVAMTSISVEKESNTLGKYVQQFGNPEVTLLLNQETAYNPQLNLSIWMTKGAAVFSEGKSLNGLSSRVQRFSPTSLENYLNTFGPQYRTREKTQLLNAGTPIPYQTVIKPQDRAEQIPAAVSVSSPRFFLFGFFLFVIVTIVVSILLYKRIKKQKVIKSEA